MKRIVLAACLAALPTASFADENAVVAPAFAPVRFLIGDWSGTGTSDAGVGSGSDSFHLEVQGRAIVRRSHATYRGKDGAPATSYDSLMTIYADADRSGIRADYIDSGGHVIHYSFRPNADPHVAQFVSDASPGTPTFRLTYTDGVDDTTMTVTFEMAPPGSTTFATTIAAGELKRKI